MLGSLRDGIETKWSERVFTRLLHTHGRFRTVCVLSLFVELDIYKLLIGNARLNICNLMLIYELSIFERV